MYVNNDDKQNEPCIIEIVSLKPNIQNSIKVHKVFSQYIRKHVFKSLGNSVI